MLRKYCYLKNSYYLCSRFLKVLQIMAKLKELQNRRKEILNEIDILQRYIAKEEDERYRSLFLIDLKELVISYKYQNFLINRYLRSL